MCVCVQYCPIIIPIGIIDPMADIDIIIIR